MKKLFFIFFIFVGFLLNAELYVTKTMDSTCFMQLKEACCEFNGVLGNGSDDVITWFHHKMVDATRDGEDDDPYRDLRVDFIPAGQSGYYSKLALLGAIGRGFENPDDWEYNLIRASDYLLEEGFIDYEHQDPVMQSVSMNLRLFADYATESSVFGYNQGGTFVGGEFSDGSWSDCLTYGTLLNDVALIVDMLWYYPSADTVALAAKLDILARWAYEFMREENNYAGYWAFTDNPDYPDSLRTLWHQGYTLLNL